MIVKKESPNNINIEQSKGRNNNNNASSYMVQ